MTGGLPFFGGAGNNYSAHALVEAVQKARGDAGSFAFVGANGGWMSKYSSGVYSTTPADWSGNDRFDVLPKAKDQVSLGASDFERATIESYTINRTKKGDTAVWIGRDESGGRVTGNADLSDEATRAVFEGGEPFGDTLTVTRDDKGRNIGRLAPRAGL